MKKGQTSKRGGYEDILLPMEYFNCSQGDFVGNHPSYACDMTGKDSGRDYAYFPFSAKCVAMDIKNGNAVWWESLSPVRFADGSIDYCTIMIVHDNNMGGIFVGVTYAQGNQMAQEGNAGNATGNHLHLEIAKGKFTKMYAQNAKGYYLPNGIAIETCCFADDTIFLNSANWGWKYTNDVPVTSDTNNNQWSRVEEHATFTVTIDTPINVRSEPTTKGQIVAQYTKGQSVVYDSYVKNEGYVWISYIANSGNRRYMVCREIATNKPYGTFK